MKKWISLLLALMLSIGAVSFSGAALAEDTTVSFSADSIYLAVGDTAKASVTVRPYVANRKGVTFQVSDEGIATVTSKGKVTAVAVGECQLTATSVYDPAVSASIPVRVVVPVTDVRLTADSDTLFVVLMMVISTFAGIASYYIFEVPVGRMLSSVNLPRDGRAVPVQNA